MREFKYSGGTDDLDSIDPSGDHQACMVYATTTSNVKQALRIARQACRHAKDAAQKAEACELVERLEPNAPSP